MYRVAHLWFANNRVEKAALENKVRDQRKMREAREAEYKANLDASNERADALAARVAELETAGEVQRAKTEQMDKQVSYLKAKATKGTEDLCKLKILYAALKKDEDIIKLLFGDLAYASLARNSFKAGQLEKQGGANMKKWEPRHVAINDVFLCYYGSDKDKTPKGIVRLDTPGVAAAPFDLAQNGFVCVVFLAG